MTRRSKGKYKSVPRFSGKIPLCNLCRTRLAQEMHHIIPVKSGGSDKRENLIPLCKSCHRNSRLHSNWESRQIELYTLKFYMEAYDRNPITKLSIPKKHIDMQTLPKTIPAEAPKTEVLHRVVQKPMVVNKAERIDLSYETDQQPVRSDVRPLEPINKKLLLIISGLGNILTLPKGAYARKPASEKDWQRILLNG